MQRVAEGGHGRPRDLTKVVPFVFEMGLRLEVILSGMSLEVVLSEAMSEAVDDGPWPVPVATMTTCCAAFATLASSRMVRSTALPRA